MKTIIRSEKEKAEFIDFVSSKVIDGAYTSQFSKIRRKRSLSQNAYMWLIITIGSQETGNDKTDLYYYFLDRYPTTREVDISDKVYLVPVSSSAFNTPQMSIFIENIRRELDMMGIATPDVDDDRAIDAFNFYKERGLI